MNRLITVALVLGMSTPAFADDRRQVRHQFYEYADVVDVSPIYRQVSYEHPKRECWIEEQQHVIRNQQIIEDRPTNHRQRSSNGGDVLIGGIIGGVIGNQLGRGGSSKTRDGATALGAIVGSVIANEASGGGTRHRNNHRQRNQSASSHRHSTTTITRPVEHCKNTVEIRYEKRIVAYDVTYDYRGRTYSTRMKSDPGSQIRLKVNVEPVLRGS
ncbi:MAG: glycine zipper 2TM domain-containing protein [Gammaproteobacteria bacterium]|nr:glycine zipper 2TM domain-containing protein [Gammaproteobacteria bacterium]